MLCLVFGWRVGWWVCFSVGEGGVALIFVLATMARLVRRSQYLIPPSKEMEGAWKQPQTQSWRMARVERSNPPIPTNTNNFQFDLNIFANLLGFHHATAVA